MYSGSPPLPNVIERRPSHDPRARPDEALTSFLGDQRFANGAYLTTMLIL